MRATRSLPRSSAESTARTIVHLDVDRQNRRRPTPSAPPTVRGVSATVALPAFPTRQTNMLRASRAATAKNGPPRSTTASSTTPNDRSSNSWNQDQRGKWVTHAGSCPVWAQQREAQPREPRASCVIGAHRAMAPLRRCLIPVDIQGLVRLAELVGLASAAPPCGSCRPKSAPASLCCSLCPLLHRRA